jgi:radical SAM superfamily enzyme YgiQ (UPF0313 family)
MRALLINPLFPETYWSQRHALPYVRKRCLLPPLGLITVAAMLPENWEIELVDLNVETLSDEQLRAADVAMLTGMLAQSSSLHETLRRCQRLGVRSVVGGPYATSVPEGLEEADHLVIGEAEALMGELAADLEAGRARRTYRAEERPRLDSSPVPRYDLLRRGAYHHMALQFSRGCPFNCEFCDITAMFGKTPRTKDEGQVLAELESIRKTGFKGDVFFVDDNFIGNKHAVRSLLPQIADWRQRTRAPLSFYTEASMNLSQDDGLMTDMVRAGFTATFVGIETPSESALRETGKFQNIKMDLTEGVHRLLSKGLDVWGGFIVGFDSEGEDIFDRMIRFVQESGIPYAMVGMLQALPNTELYRRLNREGRLKGLPHDSCDQFGCTNFVTRMDSSKLLEGYHRLLSTIYNPEAYFERCRRNIEQWMPTWDARRRYTAAELMAAVRSLMSHRASPDYRRSYRRFLRWAATHHPRKLGRAIAQSIVGHHYVTYTRQTVLPQLERQLAQLTENAPGGEAREPMDAPSHP